MINNYEFEGTCPSCGDHMTYDHCNFYPTWSDDHDNIVCWWCAKHNHLDLVTST